MFSSGKEKHEKINIKPCADEISSFSLLSRKSFFCPALHAAAQMRRLDLSTVNRQDRVLAHEAGDDVGAALNNAMFKRKLSQLQTCKLKCQTHYAFTLNPTLNLRWAIYMRGSEVC
jgi:hypothetical protein